MNDAPTEIVLAITSFPADGDVQAFARSFVEARLVACATVLPRGTSLYWWDGTVENAEEHVVLWKTPRALVPAFTAALLARHPYATPELLVLDVRDGNPAYLDWVVAETRVPQEGA